MNLRSAETVAGAARFEDESRLEFGDRNDMRLAIMGARNGSHGNLPVLDQHLDVMVASKPDGEHRPHVANNQIVHRHEERMPAVMSDPEQCLAFEQLHGSRIAPHLYLHLGVRVERDGSTVGQRQALQRSPSRLEGIPARLHEQVPLPPQPEPQHNRQSQGEQNEPHRLALPRSRHWVGAHELEVPQPHYLVDTKPGAVDRDERRTMLRVGGEPGHELTLPAVGPAIRVDPRHPPCRLMLNLTCTVHERC